MTTKPKKPAVPPVQRRDSAGHIDPKYAADLLALGHTKVESQSDDAFLHHARSKEELAESLGEGFVENATSGEDENEDARDAETLEERGGPFVTTTGKTEFAKGTDASNPRSSEREPFPKT